LLDKLRVCVVHYDNDKIARARFTGYQYIAPSITSTAVAAEKWRQATTTDIILRPQPIALQLSRLKGEEQSWAMPSDQYTVRPSVLRYTVYGV